MSNKITTTKSINWSYPSSPNAVQFGFPSGCWSVEVGLKPISGFATPEQAVEFAHSLPQSWAKFQLHAQVMRAMVAHASQEMDKQETAAA